MKLGQPSSQVGRMMSLMVRPAFVSSRSRHAISWERYRRCTKRRTDRSTARSSAAPRNIAVWLDTAGAPSGMSMGVGVGVAVLVGVGVAVGGTQTSPSQTPAISGPHSKSSSPWPQRPGEVEVSQKRPSMLSQLQQSADTPAGMSTIAVTQTNTAAGNQAVLCHRVVIGLRVYHLRAASSKER